MLVYISERQFSLKARTWKNYGNQSVQSYDAEKAVCNRLHTDWVCSKQYVRTWFWTQWQTIFQQQNYQHHIPHVKDRPQNLGCHSGIHYLTRLKTCLVNRIKKKKHTLKRRKWYRRGETKHLKTSWAWYLHLQNKLYCLPVSWTVPLLFVGRSVGSVHNYQVIVCNYD